MCCICHSISHLKCSEPYSINILSKLATKDQQDEDTVIFPEVLVENILENLMIKLCLLETENMFQKDHNLFAEIIKLSSKNCQEHGRGRTKFMTLRNVNLLIEAGELVAVVGSTGCSKSSLLAAILGDVEPTGPEKACAPRDPHVPKSNMMLCYSQSA